MFLNHSKISDESNLILVVDDDAVLRKLLVLMLRKIGFSADSVDNGRKALWRVNDCNYKLILMDVAMPCMDGYEATAAIRTYENLHGRAPVPIIAVTGQSDRDLCLACGMSDFMQKPITLVDLSKMIRKWLPEGEWRQLFTSGANEANLPFFYHECMHLTTRENPHS